MFSVKQAAERLSVSASKVYALANARKIGHYRIGGKVLFDAADLDAYLATCRVAPQAPTPPPPPAQRPPATLRHLTLGGSAPRRARARTP